MIAYMSESEFNKGAGEYQPLTQEAFDGWINSVKWDKIWGKKYSGSRDVTRFIGANQKVFVCDKCIFVPTEPKPIVVGASYLVELCGEGWRQKVPEKNYTLNELEKLLPELFMQGEKQVN